MTSLFIDALRPLCPPAAQRTRDNQPKDDRAPDRTPEDYLRWPLTSILEITQKSRRCRGDSTLSRSGVKVCRRPESA